MNVRTLAALALGATLATAAPAQSYYKRDMIDHDQRRLTLPLGGNMYCCPTAYSDLFMFMKKHGMDFMTSAWDDDYTSVTSLISQLAGEMGTNPATGTGDPNDSMVDWVEDHTDKLVVHTEYGPKCNFGPETLRGLVGMGAMVRVAYGRYKRSPVPMFQTNEWKRDTGHVVALAGYDWTDATKKILVADPASDDKNLLAQGKYTQDPKVVSPITIFTTSGDVLHLPRWSTSTGQFNELREVIDSVHSMLPMWAGWFTTPSSATPSAKAMGGTAKPVFHASFPFQLEDGVNRAIHDVEIPMPGAVRDWCMDHGLPAIYVLGEDDVVSRVDLFTKETTRVAAVPGARKLAVAGTNLDLYLLVEGGKSDQIVRIDRNTGVQTSINAPKGISGIEPNPNTRGILALYPAQKLVASFDERLRGVELMGVDLPAGEGAPYFGVDESGKVTLGRSGAKSLVQVVPGLRPRQIALRAPMVLRDFQAAGKRRFVAQDGNRLVTLDADGKTVSSQFDGMEVAGRVRFSQSWRAMRPEDVTGPGWYNVPPDPY